MHILLLLLSPLTSCSLLIHVAKSYNVDERNTKIAFNQPPLIDTNLHHLGTWLSVPVKLGAFIVVYYLPITSACISYIFLYIKPYNHKMAWIWRHPKDNLAPTPVPQTGTPPQEPGCSKNWTWLWTLLTSLPSLASLQASFWHWEAAMRCPYNLSFSRLNSPSFLSQPTLSVFA